MVVGRFEKVRKVAWTVSAANDHINTGLFVRSSKARQCVCKCCDLEVAAPPKSTMQEALNAGLDQSFVLSNHSAQTNPTLPLFHWVSATGET